LIALSIWPAGITDHTFNQKPTDAVTARFEP
jgi:hypothetical protein